jgi:hypothetical protein
MFRSRMSELLARAMVRSREPPPTLAAQLGLRPPAGHEGKVMRSCDEVPAGRAGTVDESRDTPCDGRVLVR